MSESIIHKPNHFNLKDLLGKRFHRLVVLKREENVGRMTMWSCRCDCGKETVVQGGNLRSGHTKSCGCLNAEMVSARTKKHGLTGSYIFGIWTTMKRRCSDPKNHKYPRYGGRGITVCDRWMSLDSFYKDMGDRPTPKHSIDRIDNDGDYTPENCRWATAKQQQRNTKKNRMLTYNGQTMCVAEWTELLSFSYYKIYGRLAKGWSVERTLTTP